MSRITFPALVLLAVAACERHPSESPVILPPGMEPAHVSAPPAAASPASTQQGLHWDDPAAWHRQPPASAMRRAQYTIPHTGADTADAELVVFYFGEGQGGAVDQNLARWEGQFTRADGSPVTPPKVDKRTVKGIPVSVIHVEGSYANGMMMGDTSPHDHWALLGAIAETSGGPWFFKLTGPAATVASAQPAFDALVSSFRPE